MTTPTMDALDVIRKRAEGYKLGLRDVAELPGQRGYEVSYETIRAWEFRFAPLVSACLRAKRRGQAGRSWYLDETYVKVGGRWRYRYRAIDREGDLLDSMLSAVRDRAAARRFLRRLAEIAMRMPLRVTTDQHPAYGKAIRWILGRKVWHRQSQYLNNRIEQDHRAIKQRYYPMLGFGHMESATRFCSAFEELRQYLRIPSHPGDHASSSERRRVFGARWPALMTELAAAYAWRCEPRTIHDGPCAAGTLKSDTTQFRGLGSEAIWLTGLVRS